MPTFDLSIPPAYFVETEHEARQWMNHFLQSHKVNGGLGLDSETSGLSKHKDVVLIWSLSDGANRICLPAKFIHLYREPLLENPEVNFDLTNAKFDAHMFANSGADISKAGEWRDTIVQSFLLNENNQGRHGLKECIREHFDREPATFENIFGKIPPAKKGTVKKTSGDLIHAALADPEKRTAAADYAAMDAYNTTMLRAHFDNMLERIPMYEGMNLKQFFYMTEVPFTKVLWKMERRGFQVDAAYLSDLKTPMEKRMEQIQKDFIQFSGQLMKLNSTAHVRWFFFELLKKTPWKMTDGGTSGLVQPSVDAEVLEDWAGQGDEWAKLLLEYRGINKIYGTYVTSIMDLLDPVYRVHTTLNQTGAQSGRLSSSDPNLQNLPRASEDEFKIREAFIASEKKRLIVADYEQLEMRLMAHFSRDQKMIDAIIRGTDLHCLTVSEMYGIPYDEVMAAKKADKMVKSGKQEALSKREEQLLFFRQAAKATGFGIIYGIGGPRLAAQLTKLGSSVLSPEEGFALINKWFSVFPGVQDFIEAMKLQIARYGYVQTLTGRFRRSGNVTTMSKRDRSQTERTLINAIIQGSAADVAKNAMLQAEHDAELNYYGAQMLLQVHDELIFEVPDVPEVVDACKARIKTIMENPFSKPLLVPLPAEVGSAWSWAAAK
jgi:DNA polymerase-1